MTWEYTWFTQHVSAMETSGEKLDELGAEGWELVSVVSDGSIYLRYFLKRAIDE